MHEIIQSNSQIDKYLDVKMRRRVIVMRLKINN